MRSQQERTTCFRLLGPWGIVCVALIAASEMAHGKYAQPTLEQVPIARLAENLTRLVEKDPKSAEARLNLARAHAMAYAEKISELPVATDKVSAGAWFGYGPRHVPFDVKKTDDKAKLSAANAQLEQAIQRYAEAAKLGPKNLTIRLGHAWTLSEAGRNDEAIPLFRKTIEDGWAQEKNLEIAGLGWHSVTAEAAGYLIPLLDAKKDAAEIQTLKERIAQMEKVSVPITPIAIPLVDDVDALALVDPLARVRFDLSGTGREGETWNWIRPEAGWLVYDPRQQGKITSGRQLFGSVTFWMFWENGYQALAALDDNQDGKLTGGELTGLAVWRDANSNGSSEPGEVRPLAAWGIRELSCRWQIHATHPDRIAYSPAGVVLEDGRTRPTFDLILKAR